MTVILALMSLVLLTVLGTSMTVIMNTELRAAANYSASREALYAADGVLQIAACELLAIADWNALLSSGALSRFVDGVPSGSRRLGDGSTVDLTQVTNAVNTEPRPWGPNNPVWRLFSFGPLGTNTYVIAWIGDDPAENDGDPSIENGGAANPGTGILAIRAEAFGAGGAHAVLESTVRRDAEAGSPMLRVLSWNVIR